MQLNYIHGFGQLDFYMSILARLLAACVLGGIIGYEREGVNRPAGFRTHILVCVGAALVMVTSEFLFKRYAGQVNIDPARLGAQVISGIGFLGAGTIMREGFNVKGLTTAASLWAVSCVGLAAGIGFYEGAIAATIIIYLTLITLKKIESSIAKKNKFKTIFIKSQNLNGQIGSISNILGKYNVPIRNIEFINSEDETSLMIKILVKIPNKLKLESLLNELHNVNGVQKVYEE